jgi:hypothetical protein
MHTVETLHGVLECCDSLAVSNQSRRLRRCRVPLDKVSANVALDATRVVTITVRPRVFGWRCVAQCGQRAVLISTKYSIEELYRSLPKVDLHVFERSFRNASTTIPSRLHSVAVVCHFLALTAHARLAAVEEWRRLGCAPSSPVPVRLRAIVPALSLQRTFVCPCEIPVPGEKVACSVDAHGIFHVNNDEVVVTCLGSWICCRAEFGRSLC